LDILTTEFGILALLGGAMCSVMTSITGVVVVVRRMAFFGSGIAHLAFAGVGLALVLHLPILPVVVITAVASALVLGNLSRRGVHEDVGIAIIFSSSMALGLILTQVSGVDSSRIMAYLFGDILAVGWEDVRILAALTVAVVVYMALFKDHLIYMTFDEDYAKILGIKIRVVYYSFLVLLAIVIVLSIKIVGIILVSAMLIIPPATAFQLSRTYHGALRISPVLAVLSVFLGLLISYSLDFPTGATVVIIEGAVFFGVFSMRILAQRM